jgi:hypothetical protein
MLTLRRLARSLLPTHGLATFRQRHFLFEMLVALSLAFLVWLYTYSRGVETLDMISIPVQINLASGTAGNYDLEIQGTNRVPVSFTGPPSRIRELRGLLQRGAVQATVTLAVPEERQKDNTYRDTIEVQAAAIPVPPGIMAVVTEGRNQIPVRLHRLAERHLPVRLEYVGELNISQVKLEPATVLVRGPKAILDRTRSLATQPYTPPSSWENSPPSDAVLRAQVPMVSELEGHPVQVSPPAVSIRFRLFARQKVYELTGVPIQFLCPPDFPWQPRFPPEQPTRIDLRVMGPAGDEPPVVRAYIDLTLGTFGRGRNVEPVRLQLPRDYQLAQDGPPRVEFLLEPITKSPDGPGR